MTTEILNVEQKQDTLSLEVTWLLTSFHNVLYMGRTNSLGLYCRALWLHYSTTTFNMGKGNNNNSCKALMGIARWYGQNISGEFCTNSIDIFEAVLRKMISSLRGRLHKSVNTDVVSYESSMYFITPSPLCPLWNMEAFILCEKVI